MTPIRLQNGLPFVSVTLVYGGRQLVLINVLLDTGSAGTVFSSDALLAVGLHYAAEDNLRRIRGVGGTEFVFTKRVDSLMLGGALAATNFEIEVGAMDDGFVIEGIVGTDFLIRVGAVVDLDRLEVRKSGSPNAAG